MNKNKVENKINKCKNRRIQMQIKTRQMIKKNLKI